MKARENPFSTHALERLPYAFQGGDSWAAFMARLVQQHFVGAIIGAPGSGKTLLLDELVPKLEAAGFVPVRIRLSSSSSMREKEKLASTLRSLSPPELVLLDGAEQLSTRQWLPVRAAAGRAAGLIITGHRVGRLPTVIQCDTNRNLLESLVTQLTGADLPRGEAEQLLYRHFGNVRDCFRELYDRWTGGSAAEEPINGHGHALNGTAPRGSAESDRELAAN